MRTLSELQKELYDLSNVYEDICSDYADAKQVYEYQDEMKKVVQNKIKKECVTTTKPSQAFLDAFSFSHPEYEKYLKSLSDTNGVYLHLQGKKEAIKNKIEAIITLISLEKEMMRLR